MRRRRRSGPGVSLFAFQDIITAVAGIFILITLILCLQLQLKKHSKAKDRPAVDSRLQADVIEAEARALALQAEYDTQVQMQAEISELNRFNQADKLREMAVELDSAKQVLASMQSQVESLAEEVMTAAPMVARPDMLASEALAIMEAKKITCLFAVDDAGVPCGILHIHDCLRAGVV